MLRTRVISGVVMLALVLVIALIRGPLLVLGIAVAATIAVLEFCAMARAGGHKPMTPMAVVLTLASIAPAAAVALGPMLENLPGLNLGQLWLIQNDAHPGLVDMAGFGLALGAVPMLALLAQWGDRREPWLDVGLTLAGALYCGGLLKYSLLLNREPGEGWWILLVILGTSTADSGAYFAGRQFGKAKMIPHISPGKTWAGFWGGQVACIVAVLLLSLGMNIPLWHVPFLGIAMGVASVTGDLCESLLKRGFGVKDSGTWIPGHGGLLDRLDSILFVLIVVYFYATNFYA